ncbi:hypothetical protein SAMN05421812_12154 [Asanoa hainanensis]|uniref:Uncharacterized protein n=1 Tax=Asanoa hainanensis TaxID=560556 RepID=A0A239PDZ3_9ACTN|nr:hypothetical protein [Asanoa hainanensis]SNT65286.1 hypothetical protein SAMN05421812_12154 [Asanoa hainanensis]
MAGYELPLDQPTAAPRRIPAGQPFELSLNLVRLGLYWVGAMVVVGGLQVLLIGDYLLLPVALAALPALLILFVYLATNARRGPTLAINPEGIWVSLRVRGFVRLGPQFTAVFVPWAAIDRIYVRRVALDKRICVAPRNPREFHLRSYPNVDVFDVLQRFYGTPLHASLTFGDRPADSVLETITRYAAGRTPIEP